MLTVTDNEGLSRQKTESVTVQAANIGPTAAFTATLTDRVVAVDGGDSEDQDGSIVSYAWDFGDGASGSGAQTSHTYTSAGTFQIVLTVTDDRGATDTATESVTVAAPTVIASDAFARTVANDWGTADVGGAWTRSGSASNFAVAPGKATINMAAGSGPSAYLNGVSARDVDLTTTLSYDKPGSGGGAYTSFIVRRNGTSDYRTTIRMTATVVTVDLRRKVAGTEAILGQTTLTGGALAANQVLNVRLQAVGANATTLRVKVWRAGTAEPAAWMLSFSDSGAGLQQAGSVGVYSYLSGSATNGPIKAQIGSFTVEPA
ncbi:PKD domain-containing protein [Tessaracoccus sp. HDW20]|nr:PKD domain-containing protein [Tessaracoccus coleopterorum]